jgi:hypothetical protein
VLAYVFWHSPADGTDTSTYERAAEGFHRSLAHARPAGFRASAVYRVSGLPWHAVDAGYEDWYLVEDFSALGVLNEAAVAHRHRTAHDEVAHRFGAGAGGLYRTLEGEARLVGGDRAIWVARPRGVQPPVLGELLGDGMDGARASLWRRQLVFGPAPEYCLLAHEPPAGVAPTRLPRGWSAIVGEREAIWSG